MPEYDVDLLEKYSKTMGFSVHGFNFVFSVDELLQKTITPSPELINSMGGFEEMSIISKEIFKVPQEKLVKTAIDSYIKKLTVDFIYESYFLYDKINFIKETFITEINKKILIYSSISYFGKKTENEIFRINSPENSLKLSVEEDTTKNSVDFQLTSISGKYPKIRDKKIYNLSLTQIGSKKKKQMAEPIESVIIQRQQKFELNDTLNPF